MDTNIGTTPRTGSITIAGQTLTVNQDGGTLSGNPTVPLPFHAIAAEYSKPLDRIIIVSANPNVLHMIDGVTHDDRTVALPLTPLAISVSPDGLHAAVGHDGLVSYVNLSTAALDKTFPITASAAGLILSNASIFTFQQWSGPSLMVDIATGHVQNWGGYFGLVSGASI